MVLNYILVGCPCLLKNSLLIDIFVPVTVRSWSPKLPREGQRLPSMFKQFAENVKTRRYIVVYLCELGIFSAPYPKQVSHVKAMLRGPFATTIRRDTALQHCFELLHHCSNIVAIKNLVANISLIDKEDQFQSNY